MSVIGLVRNDGTIGGASLKAGSAKTEQERIEQEILWIKSSALNCMVIQQHGLNNAVGNLAKAVEQFIEEKWEENPEFDLTQEHKNYEFAGDVLDLTMNGLDIDYKSESKPDYVGQLDFLIRELTKLRKRYGAKP